ncbi:MAG: monovalent cation/H(+) antiporter subunit G [Hyphomicrobiaceae bacterium]
MTGFLNVAGALLLVLGSTIVALAGIGILRLADPFMRMHAATKAGVVGVGLMLIGIGCLLGTVGSLLTALAAIGFLFLTSPIASHMLGRAAYISGAPLSPETIRDALEGVLPRQVVDISPGRTVRRRRVRADAPFDQLTDHQRPAKEAGMSIVPMREQGESLRSASGAEVDQGAAAIRHLTVWLAGGPAQPAASRLALQIARSGSANITALSAIEVATTPQAEAVPLGGGYWARWRNDQQRLKARAAAANALSEFEAMAGELQVRTTQRHEEIDLANLPAVAAGCDLIVVPAGQDPRGMPCEPPFELAAVVARSGMGPVLRVSRRPLHVRRIGLLVDGNPLSGRLAQTLIHTGLWRDAAVSVLAIGDHRRSVQQFVSGQTELLRSHGYTVAAPASLRLSCELEEIDEVTRPLDLLVACSLGRRRASGWFEALRVDIHAAAARHVPLTLLP